MLNRAAVILKYKQPAIDWINKVDPYNSGEVTLKSANEESTVYLIGNDDAENLDEWIKLNYLALFSDELFGWYVDETLWPEKLSIQLFRKFFTVECHTVLKDTVGEPLFDDEI